MAKKGYIYQVTMGNEISGVRTVKQVSDLIGKKVTKKEIEEGLVENVAILEDPNVELTEEQLLELEETGITEIEEVEEVEEDIKEPIEDDIEESEEQESLKDEDDLEESLEDDIEDDTEEPEEIEEIEKEGELSMTDLLKKLQENNAKIAKENPEKMQPKKRASKVVLETDEDGNIVYPEKGYFKDEDHIKKYYKQLSNEQLDEWLELEGLEYKPNEHEGIDRMRKCMAIREYHFPKEPKAKKSKSKYADFTTEELLQMALDNDVEVKEAKGNNMNILRMYTIMALRDAGVIE